VPELAEPPLSRPKPFKRAPSPVNDEPPGLPVELDLEADVDFRAVRPPDFWLEGFRLVAAVLLLDLEDVFLVGLEDFRAAISFLG